ncbi:hypothetical protein ATSB10_03790 [Dyella thiooxydans]|uniref:Uncharacterized protein n=1 Tax=Dyella thiooxydans TaxID=445710 RepID=A0A160MX68_9GAMM|nr:hypothetical protein ATSB10_03790 [Dyella thiooxydans]
MLASGGRNVSGRGDRWRHRNDRGMHDDLQRPAEPKHRDQYDHERAKHRVRHPSLA